MRIAKYFMVFIMCFIISIFSNSLFATPSVQKSTGTTALRLSKPAWQQRWDETVAAAKKEGSVRVAITGGPEIRNSIKAPFEKRFGIEAEFTSGNGAQQAGKIAAERRAGLYTTDIYCLGNSTSVTMLKPQGWLTKIDPVLILPEVSDPKFWRAGKIPYLDRDHMMIGFVSASSRRVLINTELIKKEQMGSYFDLLKPEWRGKIVMDDASIPGPGNAWMELMHRVFNGDHVKLRDYLKQLLKQEPVIIRDRRAEVEWVARGKYPICLGFHLEIGAAMKAAGAPIDIPVMKEGALVHSASGTVGLSNRPPHPNAAIVFINWLLSQEGQIAFLKGYGNPSARLDVPTTGIDPAFLPVPGEKLHEMDEELLLESEELQKTFQEEFRGILK